MAKANPAFAQIVDHRRPHLDAGALAGISRGIGSAASGVGEGIGKTAIAVGSVAKGAAEAAEGVGHAIKRVASLGEDESEPTRQARAAENEAEEAKLDTPSSEATSGEIAESNAPILRGEARPDASEAQTQPEVSDACLRSNVRHQSAYDSGISWGRSGSVEATRERGQEQIPEGAAAGTGFGAIEIAGSVSPIPATLGRPLQPVSGHGATLGSGWSMKDIISNTNYSRG